MNAEVILFLTSALPVFLIGLFIYKKDREKEPVRLLIKLFIGGISSCFLVLMISPIIDAIIPILGADSSKLNLLELAINIFIGVALIEEGCKWLMVYLISYKDSSFDHLYDAILYGVFVALGFAFFENLMYVYQGGISTGILRAILAVPGHACDGMIMGYYLGLAKMADLNGQRKQMHKNIVLSILMPTIVHGIYDYCLTYGNVLFLLIFLVFIVLLYIYSLKKVKEVSSITTKMKYKDNFCPVCGHKVESNYCPICGRKND